MAFPSAQPERRSLVERFSLRLVCLSLWLPPGDALDVGALVTRGASVPGSYRTVTIRETVLGATSPKAQRRLR